MMDKALIKARYLLSLAHDQMFKSAFLGSLETLEERAMQVLRSTSSTERELFTAQGQLQIFDAIHDLLNSANDDIKRLERRKEKLNGRHTDSAGQYFSKR